MCRYAFKNYKTHFVCFDCRKQFKRPPLTEVFARRGTLGAWQKLQSAHHDDTRRTKAERATGKTLDGMRSEYGEAIGRCPQCGQPMADLGLDFKPPRVTAVRAWERLRATYRLDHAWHTCGCSGPGFVPRDATEYALYLTRRLEEFERMIEIAKRAKEQPERAAAIRHFTELVAEVHRERSRRGANRAPATSAGNGASGTRRTPTIRPRRPA